jgi:Ni/Fe-hydrogenase 1 B-type cytochrome subunit
MTAAADVFHVSSDACRVRVWSWPVRLTHWAIFLSVMVLSVTGFYLGRPFITVSGPARDHFVTGSVKVIHNYAAIVFSLSVLARIAWMFTRDRYANWRNFIPTTRKRWRHASDTFLFYSMLRKRPPPTVGHNALAGLTYVLVFVLYLLMIATGLAIYGTDAHVGSIMHWFGSWAPYFGGLQRARWIHHIGMWLLIGFIVHHVYSATLMSVFEKTGTVDSIFSGYKFVDHGEEDD